MSERGITYDALAERSGVKRSTAKAWRTSNAVGVAGIQATLNAVGLQALPCPRATVLPAELLADLEALAARHGIPTPINELMMVAASRRPSSTGAPSAD